MKKGFTQSPDRKKNSEAREKKLGDKIGPTNTNEQKAVRGNSGHALREERTKRMENQS